MSARQSIDLPIGTEQEVHVSAEEKKKIRVDNEIRKGSCIGCIFEDDSMCIQDSSAMLDKPEYECTAPFRADKMNVIFVEVKDESI